MKWRLLYIPKSAPDACAVSCCMLAIKEGEPENISWIGANGRMLKLWG